MQEIKELVSLTDVEKLQAEGLWSFLFESGSKMEQFCLAVYTNAIKTDEEALNLLYGGKKAGNKYYNLKERLKERLTFAITLLESKKKSFSSRQSAFFECNRKWSAAMVLLSKQSRTAAIGQLESLLPHITYYEFTELTVSITSLLRVFYGTINGNHDKYLKYHKIHEQYQQVWLHENAVEAVYAELMRHYLGTRAPTTTLKQKAREAFGTIQPILASCPAFKVQLLGRLIELKVHEGDYRATANLCEDAIAFFQTKPYDSRLPLQAFYYNLIGAYIQLKEFEKGRDTITSYQSVTEDGSFNWFKLQELFFQLAVHTGNYDTGLAVLSNVKKHLRSDWLPLQTAEIWKIYEAYIHYLGLVGKIANPGSIDQVGFKSGKFLNEIPTFSRDKRGMNIPILIIQILITIARKEYTAAIDRVEAIEKYCSRYLKKGDETFRSNCFIKMLLQIPEFSFHREAVTRNTKHLRDQLHSVPLGASGQAHEIEIIPYETLWELAISTLENRLVRTRAPRDRKKTLPVPLATIRNEIPLRGGMESV